MHASFIGYNPIIITTSILILSMLCLILILMVFMFALLYWRQKKNIPQKINKHYLTALPNRLELLHTLENVLNVAKIKAVNVALLYIDVDDFNNINSALGHKIGDSLLLNISKTIHTVAHGYSKYTFHIGDDEFAVILYDYGNSTNILSEVANEIVHAVANPINIEGYELHNSCSIGICIYPECANDAEALLKNAGSARDDAKKIGFSSISFYTVEMSKKSIIRTLISSDLRYALERNEFYLQYQPQIDLNSKTVKGVEALLRWRHPSLGNLSSDTFISAIEDFGLIHSVGKWVIYTACKDISRLHNSGFADLSVAINISAHQFNKGDIGNIVSEAIWETGIAADKVEIELTEAVVMTDTEKSRLMLKVLRSMGVKIAVDDFGMGYSSISQLMKFPIDILKIDKIFVHNMHLNQSNFAIVSNMIHMGKQLGFMVIAEGVECQEEVDILQQEDCELVQGFYYSKPLTLFDLTEYLKANKQVIPATRVNP